MGLRRHSPLVAPALMRRVVIVQARMTSTRLPGKVLLDLAGRPMLERQLERLAACRRADEIVLAVTTRPDDEPLVELARRLGLRWHRGSEHDVLARYAGAAREAEADLVVRVTSDCPLIDADETDAVIEALEQRRASCDYASNRLEPHLPRGLDTEVLWRDVLERMDRLASSRPAREHVTWYCYGERPELFTLHSVRRPHDAHDLRWTVDTPDDLAMVRRLYAELGLAEDPLPAANVIAYVRAHPELAAINAHVTQKDPAA
jgi:spore coat polysaccharide biosynthesis protein SpsF